MSVSSIINSNAVGSSQSDWRSVRHEAGLDFQQLIQSLQQNDLAGAQQAYADIQKLIPVNGNGSANNTSPLGTVATDWGALGQALQSGNIGSAQTALTTLEKDASAARQSFMQAMQDAQAVYAAMQQVNGAGAAASTGGTESSVQTDLNSLSQALQSGDTASAQKLLAQLEEDLKSSGQFPVHHHHHHGHGQAPQAATDATNTVTAVAGTIAKTIAAAVI